MTIHVNGLQFDTGFNGVLGPHGVGKTRLLQQMAAQDRAEQDKVCYVTCELEPFAAHTVEEYLHCVTACDTDRPQVTAGQIVAVMERMHVAYYANVRISELPKVVKVQTLIACALLRDPQYLLLDGVLDGLSFDERQHIGYILSEIGKERVIVLAGTIASAVEGLFDTVCLMHPQKAAVQIPVHTAYEWVEGKVWEYVAAQLPKQEERLVACVKQADDGVYVREIAPCEPYEEVSQVSPTLCDAYLWWSKQ